MAAHDADWHRRMITALEAHIAYLEGPTKRYRTHDARKRAWASVAATRVAIEAHRIEAERLEAQST